ncbi:MAG: hypothetical protein ABIH08_05185 [Candidatus Omnitrophota bacterium]
MKPMKISFLLTKEELGLLKSVVYLEPFLDDNVRKAKAEGSHYVVKFDPEDVEDALNALSFEPDCVESQLEKEKYFQLFEKIKKDFIRNRRQHRANIENQIRKELGD